MYIVLYYTSVNIVLEWWERIFLALSILPFHMYLFHIWSFFTLWIQKWIIKNPKKGVRVLWLFCPQLVQGVKLKNSMVVPSHGPPIVLPCGLANSSLFCRKIANNTWYKLIFYSMLLIITNQCPILRRRIGISEA